MPPLRNFNYDSSAGHRNLLATTVGDKVRLEMRTENRMNSVMVPTETFEIMLHDFQGPMLHYVLAFGKMPNDDLSTTTHNASNEMAVDAEECVVVNDYVGLGE